MSSVGHPRIHFDGVSKRYGDRIVVNDIRLQIRSGAIHCILGPNGAGKTTTMHMMLGLRAPSAGRILIDDVAHDDPAILGIRRRIGFLSDQPELYDDLTGREFLIFLAELYGVDARAIAVERHIDQLALRGELDRVLRACSLGVRKKIALVGALLSEPEILVLDEPTGALDAHAARAVKDTMREMREAGRLVVFSTHVMELAESLADTISILHQGRLIFSGDLATLRRVHGRGPFDRLEDVFLRLTADGQPVPVTGRASSVVDVA
jgi:ABC-2 type transport system ATP-binding protein